MNQTYRKKNNQNSNRRSRNHYRARTNNDQVQKAPETKAEKVVNRYDQLQEAHIQARKKYYDFYYRADYQQLDKLERHFDRTLFELRDYEARLPDEDSKVLKSARDNYGFDHTYSQNHQLGPEKYPIDENLKIEDPHTLESQIKADFAADKEESVGNYDDYKKYKGLE